MARRGKNGPSVLHRDLSQWSVLQSYDTQNMRPLGTFNLTGPGMTGWNVGQPWSVTAQYDAVNGMNYWRWNPPATADPTSWFQVMRRPSKLATPNLFEPTFYTQFGIQGLLSNVREAPNTWLIDGRYRVNSALLQIPQPGGGFWFSNIVTLLTSLWADYPLSPPPIGGSPDYEF